MCLYMCVRWRICLFVCIIHTFIHIYFSYLYIHIYSVLKSGVCFWFYTSVRTLKRCRGMFVLVSWGGYPAAHLQHCGRQPRESHVRQSPWEPCIWIPRPVVYWMNPRRVIQRGSTLVRLTTTNMEGTEPAESDPLRKYEQTTQCRDSSGWLYLVLVSSTLGVGL